MSRIEVDVVILEVLRERTPEEFVRVPSPYGLTLVVLQVDRWGMAGSVLGERAARLCVGGQFPPLSGEVQGLDQRIAEFEAWVAGRPEPVLVVVGHSESQRADEERTQGRGTHFTLGPELFTTVVALLQTSPMNALYTRAIRVIRRVLHLL